MYMHNILTLAKPFRTFSNALFKQCVFSQRNSSIVSSSNSVTDIDKTNFHQDPVPTEYDYDLIVIGGGSGGMACSKAAASLGKKVLLFDFVKPSTQGTKWGLGGTCVNVGCVPKKIMHFASLLGQSIDDAKALGWDVNKGHHNWNSLVESVRNHVRMLNFRYRTGLISKSVKYINALAKFEDEHSISYMLNNQTNFVTGANIVIAVGGRPYIPDNVIGAKEHAITSDDLFFLNRSPGKTLCVGGGYIALETGGFLTELGYDVTIALRSSVALRGFDRQCAIKVTDNMVELGTKFLFNTSIASINKTNDNKLLVTFKNNNGILSNETYDTVFYATGRYPDTKGLHLENARVEASLTTGKIPVVAERSNIPNIFCVGDVVEGKQELTPVAIKAGQLLANRLFNSDTSSHQTMDYNLVPTTVFTPIEYGCVGLTEEKAIKIYGEENVEVYLSEFTTLEVSSIHRKKHDSEDERNHNCLSKLITLKNRDELVVGFHFVGPNAGEITQGFALGLKLGAKKKDFDDLVGIHPTDAESFCSLSVTKRSGIDFSSEGCGGGTCG